MISLKNMSMMFVLPNWKHVAIEHKLWSLIKRSFIRVEYTQSDAGYKNFEMGWKHRDLVAE